MRSITIKLKDGTKREFREKGRCGGSYTISLKYVPGFAVVTDEWGSTTAIPTEDIAEINTEPGRSGW